MTDGPAPRVTVAVLTYRRPAEIARLVPQLLAQVRDVRGYAVQVLVVDNDPTGGAEAHLTGSDRADSDLANSADSDLRYVCEPTPGISAARNRALDESSGADLLVFIDDDEEPGDGWLDALLATHAATGASVAGPVVSRFDGDVDAWVAVGGFFARRHRIGVVTGTPITVAATNNLLLDLHAVRDLGLRFDPDFGLSGGEDSLFTGTLTRRGAPLVWCAEAQVVERVPAARVTRRWVLLRSVSSGNSQARVDLRLAASPGAAVLVRARQLGNGTLRMLLGVARALLGTVLRSPRHSARGLRAAARGAGMAGGALNWRYQEYRRPRSAAGTAQLDATRSVR